MDEIRIGEKVYISSKRAAEVTGYAKDYVGQLCREGHVEAKMVGRSWYVFEPSIREHRFGKEVQSSEGTSEDQLEDGLSHDSADLDTASIETDTESVAENNEDVGVDAASVQQWERPTYKPEPVYTIPEIQESEKIASIAPARPINALESPEYRHILEESSLTDMQKAWKEWFEHKQNSQPEASPEFQGEYEDLVGDEDGNELEFARKTDSEEEIPIAITPIKPINEPLVSPYQREGESHIPVRKIAPEAEYAPQEPLQDEKYYVEEARVVSERITTRSSHMAQEPLNMSLRKATKKKRNKGGVLIAQAILISVSIISITVALVGSGIADSYIKTVSTESPATKVLKLLTGERTIQKHSN